MPIVPLPHKCSVLKYEVSKICSFPSKEGPLIIHEIFTLPSLGVVFLLGTLGLVIIEDPNE